MKRITSLLMLMACLAAPSVQAQEVEEFGYFDHLGAGVSIGTDGIGVDVATPIGNYVALRAGVSFLPNIKVYEGSFSYKYGRPSKENTVDGEINLGWVNGKLLCDVYPFKKNDFRITAGLYVGTDAFLKAQNKADTPVKTEGEGIYIGDKPFFPDESGITKVEVRSNVVKPYIGIGYGRAIPHSRVNVGVDLGIMLWGTPKAWLWAVDADKMDGNMSAEWHEVQLEDINDNLSSDINDIAQKLKIYPMLNVRVGFRLF